MEDKIITACPKCAKYLYVPSGSETVQVTCPGCQEVWAWPRPSNANQPIGVSFPVVIHLCKNCLHTLDITKTYQQPVCPKCGTDCADGGIQVVRGDEASRSINMLLLQVLGSPSKVLGTSPLSDEQNQALLTIASHAHADTRIAASPDTGIKNPESSVHDQPTPPGNLAEEKIIIACRKCAQDLSAPAGLGPIQVTCPSCRDVWDWPAGRKIITCPACSRNLQVPIVEGIIHVSCPSCSAKVEWFGKYANPIGVDIEKIKLSDFTIAGWLLVVMSVTVTGLCGYYATSLVGEPNGAIIGRLKILALVLCAGIPGIVLFLTGKWLLERKLNVKVIKRLPL